MRIGYVNTEIIFGMSPTKNTNMNEVIMSDSGICIFTT